ncbi:MAG TPA: hypothetical protein VJ201_07150 [Candidatus Babeliales bacterium]|nr:hypothetical protein [Candidatus Babeliales bacterium]
MMKKVFLIVITCLVNTFIWPNIIQDAVKKQREENVAQYMPLLKQQRETIAKLGYAWREQLTWIDETQEAQRQEIRQNQEARKLFRDFNILNAQAIGIIFCQECLKVK